MRRLGTTGHWNLHVGEQLLVCLILMWYFYERSPLLTIGYHYWQVPSFKPLLAIFQPKPFISLQVTVSEGNQPPDFLLRWKKVNFVRWLNTTFYMEKLYQKPRLRSINIIRTLVRHMEWIRSGLPNSVVIVRAQKPY